MLLKYLISALKYRLKNGPKHFSKHAEIAKLVTLLAGYYFPLHSQSVPL